MHIILIPLLVTFQDHLPVGLGGPLLGEHEVLGPADPVHVAGQLPLQPLRLLEGHEPGPGLHALLLFRELSDTIKYQL